MQPKKVSREQAGVDATYYLTALAPTILFTTVIASDDFSGLSSALMLHSIPITLGILWLIASLVIHYGVSIFGILRYGSPRDHARRNLASLGEHGWEVNKRLVICFVSQGIQQKVLRNSVQVAIEVATRLKVNFTIELVVDTAPLSDPFFSDNGCHIVHVPSSFETPGGSCFKARSLSYAAFTRTERLGSLESTWILHCDEDTLITNTSIAGIAEHLRHPLSSRMCGAGEIKYNARGFGLHRVFCMIDSHRTGEDLGRFRLQFLSKQAAMTGVHGSFFVVPAKLESDIQFDFGQRGSITEDIYFAFRLRELSVPYSWVHGHVREQSPPDLRNFLRQRARWIHGLLNMCGDRRFSLLHRLTLLVYLAMLRTTIVAGFALTLLALIYPLSPIISVLWQLSMLVVGTNVLVGLLRNIQDEEAGGGVTNAVTIAAGVCLVPVICLLETLAVARGILFRENEFFVVAKT